MDVRPPLWMRFICGIARGFLVVLSLLLGVIAGGVIIIPLAIFVLPLVVIMGGLVALTVLAATQSMAEDWHAARTRRRTDRVLGNAMPVLVRQSLSGGRAGR